MKNILFYDVPWLENLLVDCKLDCIWVVESCRFDVENFEDSLLDMDCKLRYWLEPKREPKLEPKREREREPKRERERGSKLKLKLVRKLELKLVRKQVQKLEPKLEPKRVDIEERIVEKEPRLYIVQSNPD